MLGLVAQSCPTLCNPMDCSPPGSSVHGHSPGKNAEMGCHALLQGILRSTYSTPVSSLPLAPPGKIPVSSRWRAHRVLRGQLYPVCRLSGTRRQAGSHWELGQLGASVLPVCTRRCSLRPGWHSGAGQDRGQLQEASALSGSLLCPPACAVPAARPP